MILWRNLDPKILLTVLATAVGRGVAAVPVPPPKPAPAVPAKDAVA